MNRILLVALVTVLISCTKQKEESNNTALVGKWLLTENYYSIGGPGTWHPADPTNPIIIRFAADSEFSTTGNFFQGFTEYRIIDDRTIHFLKPNGEMLQAIYVVTDKLEISPVNCIEGCTYRFIRTN